MNGTTLTGRAATDALRAYVRLGSLDARFDARRVTEALQSARGRARLLASLIVSRARASNPNLPGIGAILSRRSRARPHRSSASSRSSDSEPHPAEPAGETA